MITSLMLAGGGVVALLAPPAAASSLADETEPAAETTAAAPVEAAGTSTTLPLFGTQLTVDVSTTPSGALARVDVNPADTLTATKVHPNRVVFVNDDNTGKVRVETRHGAERIGVVAGALADIVGAGGWTGDVFGTGTPTTVDFEIVAAADGSPDITGTSSSDPSAVIGAVQHAGAEHAQIARATVTFTSGIQSRRLNIAALVFTKGDITRAASQVSLSRITGVSLPADQAAGGHTWTGMLCDGTAAAVAYSVANDGTITAGTVTPAGASATVHGDTLKVEFTATESVRIKVSTKDGNVRISADPRLRCERTDPTVNTPIATDAAGGHHRDRGKSNDAGPGHRDNDPGDSHRRGGWERGSH